MRTRTLAGLIFVSATLLFIGCEKKHHQVSALMPTPQKAVLQLDVIGPANSYNYVDVAATSLQWGVRCSQSTRSSTYIEMSTSDRVTLTLAYGSVEWSGVTCASTGPVCQFTISEDEHVTATLQ